MRIHEAVYVRHQALINYGTCDNCTHHTIREDGIHIVDRVKIVGVERVQVTQDAIQKCVAGA